MGLIMVHHIFKFFLVKNNSIVAMPISEHVVCHFVIIYWHYSKVFHTKKLGLCSGNIYEDLIC
jgi:hypothetical protein